MNNKRGSVYNQLLLIFAATVLPYMIIATFALLTSSQRLSNKTIQTERAATKKTIIELEEALDTIYQTSFILFSQSNMIKVSNRPNSLTAYEQGTEINSLREQLTTITRSNPYIQHLRVYFKSLGKIYNSARYPKGSFQDITDEEYQSLLAQIDANKMYLSKNEELSILITSASSKIPSSIIEANLSTSNIQNQLNNLTTGTEDYYLLSAAEHTFLIHNLPSNLVEEVKNLLDLPYPQNNKIQLNGIPYIMFYHSLPTIDGHFIRVISTKTLLAPVQVLSIYTIVFLAMTFLGYIAFFIITRRLIRTPLSELVGGLLEIEKGNYSIQITYDTGNDFSYLYHGFNQMAMNINNSIERDYKIKLLLQQAELKQLQAQINPHFLYNSFFMLQRIIQSGLQEESIVITELLGQYFQYITKNENDLVPLKEEYGHALIYSQIQQMRFEGRIQVDFEELPKSFSSLLVPKLILQPVIENSYKYALDGKLENGLLQIRFVPQGKVLKIYIEDNGEELSDNALHHLKENLKKTELGSTMEMNGLFNICRRLAIFSNHSGSLSVNRSSLGGLSVCITLLQEDTDDVQTIDC